MNEYTFIMDELDEPSVLGEYGMDTEELAYLGGGFSIEHEPTVYVLPDGGIVLDDGYADLSTWEMAS